MTRARTCTDSLDILSRFHIPAAPSSTQGRRLQLVSLPAAQDRAQKDVLGPQYKDKVSQETGNFSSQWPGVVIPRRGDGAISEKGSHHMEKDKCPPCTQQRVSVRRNPSLRQCPHDKSHMGRARKGSHCAQAAQSSSPCVSS